MFAADREAASAQSGLERGDFAAAAAILVGDEQCGARDGVRQLICPSPEEHGTGTFVMDRRPALVESLG